MKSNKSLNVQSEDELKSRLVELQDYPRVMLLTEIRGRNCVHDGDFCLKDSKCWGCDIGFECLKIVEKFASSEESNVHKLVEGLKVSQQYIQGKIDKVHHESRTYFCELWSWMREVNSTLSDLSEY